MENKNGVGIFMEYGGDIFVEQGRIPLSFFLEPKSMRIWSWNVQGLGGSQHLLEWIFRREFEVVGLCRTIDILLLQDHHLGWERTKKFKDLLLGDWHTWCDPAHDVLERRGGVCISLRKSPYIAILDHVILIEGRAMFTAWNGGM